jgi:drug/metabolite transporter (DMT)-like permease
VLVLIGLLAALAAATLYAAGVALQSVDARESHSDDALRPALLLGLVQRPRWLLGGVVSFLGWPLQAFALAQAPLAVVQPALAFNLVVLLAIARRLTPDPVTRADIVGALAITGGVVALALAAPARGPDDGTRTLVLVGVLAVLSALPLLLRRLALRAALLLPAIAGVAFTLLAIATRLADDTFTGHRLLAGACWIAMAGFAGYAATVCEMSAMRTRPATFVVPVTVSVESVLPILVGPIALSERLPASAAGRIALVLGVVLIVAGVALLGRSPGLAELRHEPTIAPV